MTQFPTPTQPASGRSMNTSETRPAWPTDWAGARGLRIGDAERNQASQALSEHFSLGRLSPDEFDLRQDLAWQAVSDTQLRALFADLPPACHDAQRRPPARRTCRLRTARGFVCRKRFLHRLAGLGDAGTRGPHQLDRRNCHGGHADVRRVGLGISACAHPQPSRLGTRDLVEHVEQPLAQQLRPHGELALHGNVFRLARRRFDANRRITPAGQVVGAGSHV